MSFKFSWNPNLINSTNFKQIAAVLEEGLKKGPKPEGVVGDVLVDDIQLGTIAPRLHMIEISKLETDQFKGVFSMVYEGDASITMHTRVEANSLISTCESAPLFALPRLNSSLISLPVPLQFTISDVRLSGVITLVVSKKKGVVLVFKDDPLESIKITTSMDSIPQAADRIKYEIEQEIRVVFRNSIPEMLYELTKPPAEQQDSANVSACLRAFSACPRPLKSLLAWNSANMTLAIDSPLSFNNSVVRRSALCCYGNPNKLPSVFDSSVSDDGSNFDYLDTTSECSSPARSTTGPRRVIKLRSAFGDSKTASNNTNSTKPSKPTKLKHSTKSTPEIPNKQQVYPTPRRSRISFSASNSLPCTPMLSPKVVSQTSSPDSRHRPKSQYSNYPPPLSLSPSSRTQTQPSKPSSLAEPAHLSSSTSESAAGGHRSKSVNFSTHTTISNPKSRSKSSGNHNSHRYDSSHIIYDNPNFHFAGYSKLAHKDLHPIQGGGGIHADPVIEPFEESLNPSFVAPPSLDSPPYSQKYHHLDTTYSSPTLPSYGSVVGAKHTYVSPSSPSPTVQVTHKRYKKQHQNPGFAMSKPEAKSAIGDIQKDIYSKQHEAPAHFFLTKTR